MVQRSCLLVMAMALPAATVLPSKEDLAKSALQVNSRGTLQKNKRPVNPDDVVRKERKQEIAGLMEDLESATALREKENKDGVADMIGPPIALAVHSERTIAKNPALMPAASSAVPVQATAVAPAQTVPVAAAVAPATPLAATAAPVVAPQSVSTQLNAASPAATIPGAATPAIPAQQPAVAAVAQGATTTAPSVPSAPAVAAASAVKGAEAVADNITAAATASSGDSTEKELSAPIRSSVASVLFFGFSVTLVLFSCGILACILQGRQQEKLRSESALLASSASPGKSAGAPQAPPALHERNLLGGRGSGASDPMPNLGNERRRTASPDARPEESCW